MDEQAGILKAIAESPDDVTHRLVYADWLEDHGKTPAAQFIRAQCTLRKLLLDPEVLDYDPVQSARYPVAVEVMRLLPEVRPPLLAPFLPAARELRRGDENIESTLTRQFSFWTHRGLVEDVEVYGGTAVQAFVSHANAIFDSVPLLRLMFSNAPCRQANPDYPPESASDDRVTIASVRAFLRKEAICRLEVLDLRWLHLGNALGHDLLHCKPSFRPRRLLLDGNGLREATIKRLQDRFAESVVYAPLDGDDIPF
jgi:uncharacterized protein (TIGR02996 family)